jgi:hypothetical protein
MTFSKTVFNLFAMTLAMILRIPPTRLIGRKSLTAIAPGILGISEMNEALRLF